MGVEGGDGVLVGGDCVSEGGVLVLECGDGLLGGGVVLAQVL